MELDRRKYTIYLVSAIIAVGLLFMGVTLYTITSGVGNESSRDMLIDRQVDECYAKMEKAKK
ncbi:MAG: hypothetical protein U9Q62_10220 [Campylobacterota bacterium]|nr:hypothetical protein [Campylobacterota bacterium]